jgi:hypothetical protein
MHFASLPQFLETRTVALATFTVLFLTVLVVLMCLASSAWSSALSGYVSEVPPINPIRW